MLLFVLVRLAGGLNLTGTLNLILNGILSILNDILAGIRVCRDLRIRVIAVSVPLEVLFASRFRKLFNLGVFFVSLSHQSLIRRAVAVSTIIPISVNHVISRRRVCFCLFLPWLLGWVFAADCQPDILNKSVALWGTVPYY